MTFAYSVCEVRDNHRFGWASFQCARGVRAGVEDRDGGGRCLVTRLSRVPGGPRPAGSRADPAAWTSAYLRRAALADCMLRSGGRVPGLRGRFDVTHYTPGVYLAFTGLLPLLWVAALAVAGGYDPRFIGVGLG